LAKLKEAVAKYKGKKALILIEPMLSYHTDLSLMAGQVKIDDSTNAIK
jgi:hypothetical protein